MPNKLEITLPSDREIRITRSFRCAAQARMGCACGAEAVRGDPRRRARRRAGPGCAHVGLRAACGRHRGRPGPGRQRILRIRRLTIFPALRPLESGVTPEVLVTSRSTSWQVWGDQASHRRHETPRLTRKAALRASPHRTHCLGSSRPRRGASSSRRGQEIARPQRRGDGVRGFALETHAEGRSC